MEEVTGTAPTIFLVWLVLIFVGILVWVYWPSRRRRKQMQSHAEIPFREAPEAPEDETDAASREDKKDS
jgi:cbb3-type cytochrome oxidase subunit 3